MKIFFVIIMMLNGCLCHSQTWEDICLATIVKLNNDIETGQKATQNIDTFLDCFNEYSDNVELLEFRNEVLFKLIARYPMDFINLLSNKSENICENICVDIENPIHDGINLYKAYYHILQTNNDQCVRERILNSLDKAIKISEN